jgi:hypothetical protein
LGSLKAVVNGIESKKEGAERTLINDGSAKKLERLPFRSKLGDSVTDTYGKCPALGLVTKGYMAVSRNHEILIASNFVLYCTS